MQSILVVVILQIIFCGYTSCIRFEKVFQWKQLDHQRKLTADPEDIIYRGRLPERYSFNETFDSYNNVPMGVAHHNGRLFLSIPRRRPGIPATLNVIDLTKVPDGELSPPLDAYPDYIVNQLHEGYRGDPKRIVSVYRSKIDACDRLWFVDTGMLEYPDNRMQVQRPQLWIIDLLANRKVRTFEIPETIVQQGVGMASLVVDVEPSNCDDAYAYIPDLVQGSIYVYSFQKDRMWAFNHATFGHNPENTNFRVAGQRFEWDDGIFSITVGQRVSTEGSSRFVYYHPMVSTLEFRTTTEVLQNETLANNGDYESLFESLGDRGPNTQSTMHHYDPETEVIFYAEVNRNSIGCWNTKDNFTASNHDIIQLDHRGLIYPADLNSDNNGTIWVLANNLPTWIYSRLNESQFNFNVWRQTPRTAISGTKCED